MWRGEFDMDESRLIQATLRSTHRRRIDVDIVDLNERHVGSLAPQVLDGQVTINAKAEPTSPSRTLDISFLDPDRVVDLEPGTVTGAPLHRKFMAKIHYTVLVAALGEWVQIPVFTGPIWEFERTGALVHILAHGKERQALGSQWTARPFKKKTKKTDAIRSLLRETGERRLAIPDLKVTLPDRFAVAPMDQPWVKCKQVAKSMDRHLFYDGDGLARLRTPSSVPCMNFSRSLLTDPTLKRSSEGNVNVFQVFGANPKGPKDRVHYVVALPANHASSPQSLARHGELHRLVLREENDHLKTIAECKKRALRLRDIHWTTVNDFRFDVLPDPRLDELDMVSVETDLGLVRVQMLQWTIPLGMDPAPMQIGTTRRTTRAKKKAA